MIFNNKVKISLLHNFKVELSDKFSKGTIIYFLIFIILSIMYKFEKGVVYDY